MISLSSPVETWAHRWPAGLKFALLSAATVTLFSLTSLSAQFLIFCLMWGIYLLPGIIFLKTGLRWIIRIWPFVAMLLLWHYFTDDLTTGLRLTLRMITAIGLANLVTMTTRLSDMIDFIRWALKPLRLLGVKTAYLELALALTIRFTPVLLDKSKLLHQSWRARSATRPGWRTVLPFVTMALDDADRVAQALHARGGVDTNKD